MTKIKYIHCFGTSYTAGGGFEFESINGHKNKNLLNYYGNLNEEFSQFNFSFPGQLQKLIGNDIKVYNHGKNGYGNELLYRKVYEIITEPNFNNEENIFLLEFSGLGRKEFWLNEINDFIIVNYEIDWQCKKYDKLLGIANSYWYDSDEMTDILKKEHLFFDNFLKKTLKLDNFVNTISMNNEYVLSYIQKNNVKFYLMLEPIIPCNDENKLLFGDGLYFTTSNNFTEFAYKNKLLISDETDGGIDDLHNGYIANKIVAKTIYNKFIDDLLIEFPKIDIDWEYYKNVKKFKYLNSV